MIPISEFIAMLELDLEGSWLTNRETSSANKRRKSKQPTKKQKEKQMKEMMLVGIAEDLARDEGKDSGNGKKRGQSSKRAPRKTKSSKASNKDTVGRKRTSKPASKSKPKSKPLVPANLMTNFESLFSGNVYADAGVDADKVGQIAFTQKNKAAALKDLLSSVPLEDQSSANRERELLRQATVSLGRNKVVPDPVTGHWKFKGQQILV